MTIDVEKGLARTRIEWVKERGGVEEYDGRPIKPVDNGNVTGKHLARNFPNTPKPWRGARTANPSRNTNGPSAGVITKEMIYVAARENLGRKQQLERAEAALADGEQLRRRAARLRHARNSCAARSRAAAPSSRPTSTTPNSSR